MLFWSHEPSSSYKKSKNISKWVLSQSLSLSELLLDCNNNTPKLEENKEMEHITHKYLDYLSFGYTWGLKELSPSESISQLQDATNMFYTYKYNDTADNCFSSGVLDQWKAYKKKSRLNDNKWTKYQSWLENAR